MDDNKDKNDEERKKMRDKEEGSEDDEIIDGERKQDNKEIRDNFIIESIDDEDNELEDEAPVQHNETLDN